MTQEEKQLLLKDLCARLPYGVKCQTKNGIGTLISIECSFGENLVYVDFGHSEAEEYDLNNGDTVKPYLRPMSSMTADEEYEYHQCKNIDYLEICEMKHIEMLETTALCFSHAIDWLNKKGFDYRGLIEKGLALEAPENIYEKK